MQRRTKKGKFSRGTTLNVLNARFGEDALTKEEIKKLLSVIIDLRDEVIIRIALSTGMRRKDLAGIEISNIDFDWNEIKFLENKKSWKKDKDSKKMVFVPFYHTVPVSQKLINKIQQLIKTSRASKYLFPSPQKNEHKTHHIHDRRLWDIFNNACEKAGIQKRRFHALRPSAVKKAKRKGWSVEQVAKLLNDKIETVLMYYSSPSRDEMRELVKRKPL